MAPEKRVDRQEELRQMIATISRFAMDKTYAGESRALDHLGNAMAELRLAASLLVEDRP